MNKIVIDSGIRENRVALIEKDELVDVYLDRIYDERISGNIYLGRVVNVLPGMQAAFIDIGLKKNAFLHLKDAIPRNEIELKDVNIDSFQIKDILKPGQTILVQIIKEAFNTKGPKVTTHISISGKYAVILDETKYIGVSKKIKDIKERNRLKEIAKDNLPKDMGIVIRTISEYETEKNIIADIKYLTNKLEYIKKVATYEKAPKLISRLNIVQKVIKDYLKEDIDEIIVNDKEILQELKKAFMYISEDYLEKISYFNKSHDIFGYLGIQKKIESAIEREVKLKSGASIVIDETEALTVIDVNTAKFTGSTSLEDTILEVNIEAAIEIAKQLRLRNIGGIVIIDFIDMKNKKHIDYLLDILKTEFKKDTNKTVVLGMTKLGLVEITRKKTIGRLTTRMLRKCPKCNGSGRIPSEHTVINKLQNEAKRLFKNTNAKAVAIQVNPIVKDYIEEKYSDFYKDIKNFYGINIILRYKEEIKFGDIKILRTGSEEFVKNYLKNI